MTQDTYDVAVIGSGPAGYICALHCAEHGLKTVCIEKNASVGGTCLNVGCIPSKALLQSTEFYSQIATSAEKHGINLDNLRYDFPKMMARKNQIITEFNQGIRGLFKKHKVTLLEGAASFLTPTTLQIGGSQTITAHNTVIATGSQPITLPFLPFDEQKVLSSSGALSLKQPPKTMLVVGAGVIGVELASVYQRLGTQVTFIEFLDTICPTLDPAIRKELYKELTAQGMTFHLSSKVTSADIKDQVTLTAETPSGTQTFTADCALVSIGRKPTTSNLNLEALNISLDAQKRIPVNSSFQTLHPNIYAIGDIIDGPMLAHKGSEEAIAVADLIAGEKPTVDYLAVPNVVYTHPEVGTVGLTAEEAHAHNIEVNTATFPLRANSRARCMGEDNGFVKIIAEKDSHTIVGMHMIGAHASELISIGALAIKKRMTTKELARICFAHPTLSEAFKEVSFLI